MTKRDGRVKPAAVTRTLLLIRPAVSAGRVTLVSAFFEFRGNNTRDRSVEPSGKTYSEAYSRGLQLGESRW